MATLKLDINQEKAAVQAGGVLSGTLQLRAPRTIRATRLNFYLKGKETARIVTGVGTSSTTHIEKVEIASIDVGRSIPKQALPIKKGKIRAGSYKIPFHCNLGSRLPSSLDTKERDWRSSGKVQYKLRATLKGSGVFRDYDVTRVVQVVALPKPIQRTVPCILNPIHREVTGTFGKNHGELCIGAKLLDKELVPGQKIVVHLSLQNNSLAAVKNVAVSLDQLVLLRTGGDFVKENTRKYATTIVSKEFVLSEEVKKPLDKARLKQYKEDIDSHREDDAERILFELNRAEPSQAMLLPPIPQDTMNHYEGCNIKISHRLRLKIKMGGGHNISELNLPVTVFPRNMAGPTTAEAVEVSNEEGLPLADARPLGDRSADLYPSAGVKVVSLGPARGS